MAGIGRIIRGETVDKIEENVKLSVIATDFPAQLKRCRAALKLTQEALAEKIGVSMSCVRAWEQGRQLPNFENYDAIYNLVQGMPISLELERAYLERKGQ